VRATVFALTLIIAAAPALARADATSNPDTGVVATAHGDDSDLSRWLDQAPPVAGAGDPDRVLTLGDDRRVHGEMGVGVGTNGYFDAYGAVSVPFGQTGRLGLAYDDAQIRRPWRAHQRSLAVDLSVGSGTNGPAACGNTVHVGGHDVAPLWVSNFRAADTLSDVDPRCSPQPARR
jgi:hypothetical protein